MRYGIATPTRIILWLPAACVLGLLAVNCNIWLANYLPPSLRNTQIIAVVIVLVSCVLAACCAEFFLFARIKRLNNLASGMLTRAGSNSITTAADQMESLAYLMGKLSSELLAAREQENAIVDFSLNVICALDADRRFLSANPATLRCWGYHPAELVGKQLDEILHPSDVNVLQHSISKDVQENIFEVRVMTRLGKPMDMRWLLTWSTKEQKYFCIAADITDRRDFERAKDAFFAMISHDLRTPFLTLRLTLELLARGSYGHLSEEGQTVVATSDSDIERLLRLINDLLDAEKFSEGKFSVKCSPVKVADALQEAIQPLRSVASKRAVNIDVQSSDFVVRADKDRLIQILTNLVDNAISFSPENSAVEIKLEASANWIEFKVKDCGPGLDADQRTVVFDRFKQVAVPQQSGRNGSGLGLAICKSLVLAQGGDIGVDSEPNVGSVFWFRLPREHETA